jgi:hypothetical protein
VNEVDMWMLVRDWVHARYDHIKVRKFNNDSPTYPSNHLGKIALEKDEEVVQDIGFAAPKGVLVWLPQNFDYPNINPFEHRMFYATDPQMFEKLDEILRLYEPK